MTDESLLAIHSELDPTFHDQLQRIVRLLVREELRKWASAARDAKLQEVRFLEKEYEIGKQKVSK
jgi:hypothetical protein